MWVIFYCEETEFVLWCWGIIHCIIYLNFLIYVLLVFTITMMKTVVNKTTIVSFYHSFILKVSLFAE